MNRASRVLVLAALACCLASGAEAKHRRIVLAVDGSGSMKEAGGSVALSDALAGFVRKLQPDDELALVVFDDRAALLRTPAPVGDQIETVVAQVQSISQDGQHSDLPAGLALACDAYPADADAGPIDVILVTDGIITVRAPRSAAEALADMDSRIVPRCVQAGARVHVIGVGGNKANMTVLQSLAEATQGRSEFPLGSGRLAEFFDSYIASTAPPPQPAPSSAPRRPAIARTTPSTPPPAPDRTGAIVAIVVGAILLGLALVLLAFWMRSRKRMPIGAASGTVHVKEFPGGAEHELKLPAIIGRSPSSAIHLDDREASRKHVRFEQHDGKVAVVDLGSANGTFVNGQRLREGEPRVIRAGDRLKIPGLELLVQAEVDADSTYIRQDLDRTFIRPTVPDDRGH